MAGYVRLTFRDRQAALETRAQSDALRSVARSIAPRGFPNPQRVPMWERMRWAVNSSTEQHLSLLGLAGLFLYSQQGLLPVQQ